VLFHPRRERGEGEEGGGKRPLSFLSPAMEEQGFTCFAVSEEEKQRLWP